jgi:hypothetical protein
MLLIHGKYCPNHPITNRMYSGDCNSIVSVEKKKHIVLMILAMDYRDEKYSAKLALEGRNSYCLFLPMSTNLSIHNYFI